MAGKTCAVLIRVSIHNSVLGLESGKTHYANNGLERVNDVKLVHYPLMIGCYFSYTCCVMCTTTLGISPVDSECWDVRDSSLVKWVIRKLESH